MTVEHKARIERAAYQTFLDRTEITISIPGNHDVVRSDLVTVTLLENPGIMRENGKIEDIRTAPESAETLAEA